MMDLIVWEVLLLVTQLKRRGRSTRPLMIVLIIVAVLVIAHVSIDRLYGFRVHSALGYGSVYAKNMWFEIATRYMGAIIYLFLALAAVRPLANILPRSAYRGAQILIGFVGWVIGFAMWSLDPTSWMLFLHHHSFGKVDPLFHVDISFYVYTLPILTGLIGRVIGTLALWLVVRLVTAIAAFAQQQIQISKPGLARILRGQFRGLLVVLGVILLMFTAVSVLNRYDLVLTSQNGSFVYGPDFVTAHLTLPIFTWLHAGLLFLAAIAVVWQAANLDHVFPERDGFVVPSWRSFRRPIYALGLYVSSLVVSGIVASLVNGLYVHPNQNTVELPYIKNSIDATRWALGIENVQTKPFEPSNNLTAKDVSNNQLALNNVRVNDQGQTQAIYNQLQSFKNYFAFTNAAVDRYGQSEVYIATREMDVSKLPVPTWINQTLVYTHGYGVAASPVNQFDQDGLPVVLAGNTPQTTKAPIPKVTRPEIYFGMMSNDVIAPSKQAEFDYPVNNADHTSHYQGGYGLPVKGNRLLLAFEQSNLKYFTSDQITSKSQWLFDRDIYQRVQDIAPFLTYDKDAYSFIDANGHIKWILDAYTETGNIPYAQHFMNTAYIRNSVKVVIDAYTGQTTFYVVDKTDPMIESLAATYPSLFTYKIPKDIQAHFRYPTDLFQTQAAALTRYHMTQPSAFYNQEDLWSVAQQIYNQNQKTQRPPVYQMIQMPGQSKPQFVLSELFTPQNKENLNGWLTADNAPTDYGKLTLYQFPQSNLIFGPMQAENQIDSNPTISSQLTLWNQNGSHVVRGDLLMIPLGKSMLYVEPVYLVANRANSLPQLERVIVDFNKQVYMDDSLGSAIQDLLSGVPPTSPQSNSPSGGQQGATGQGTGQQGGQTNNTGQTGGGGAGGAGGQNGAGNQPGSTGNIPTNLQGMSTSQLAQMANDLFTKYQQDTASGALATAGQDLNQLRSVLNALQAKSTTNSTANSTGK